MTTILKQRDYILSSSKLLKYLVFSNLVIKLVVVVVN
jgi:hypothetical protein